MLATPLQLKGQLGLLSYELVASSLAFMTQLQQTLFSQ